jgi:hypothetical protein
LYQKCIGWEDLRAFITVFLGIFSWVSKPIKVRPPESSKP